MQADPEVQRMIHAWKFAWSRLPLKGRAGEILGRGTGSSLEFQDYRDYQPGDEIRHLDWSAYARTDQMMVRLYREEISPDVDIVLDASRSMGTGTGEKPLLARQLAASAMLMASQLGARPRLHLAGEVGDDRVLTVDRLGQLNEDTFSGNLDLWQCLQRGGLSLRKRSLRVVVSDFLFPHDPAVLVEALSREATRVWLVQVMTSFEASPPVTGGRRLIDAESEMEADLILDEKTVAAYGRRLHELQSGLRRACRRRAALFASGTAEPGLLEFARTQLAPARMIVPTTRGDVGSVELQAESR